MGLDPTTFASVEERGAIRSRLYSERVEQLRAEVAASSPRQQVGQFYQGVAAQRAAIAPSSGLHQAATFREQVAQQQRDYESQLGDLRRKSAALVAATQPTPEDWQTAAGAVAGQSIGALNTVLNVLDTPRRWTFQNAIVPAAKKVGLVAPDEDLDPEGRDLFLKAMGGQHMERWINDQLKGAGWKDPVADAVSALPGRVAGFALDVLLDPLTYLTLGAGTGLKQGGRVLAAGGRELATSFATKAAIPASLADDLAIRLAPKAPELARKVRSYGGASIDALTTPEVDEVFHHLRGLGAPVELFRPGGAQWRLPGNSFALHVPLLNREEQIGVFLGGREISGAAGRTFDSLRRTAIDLGEAALAAIPVKAQTGALAAGGVAAGLTGNLPLAAAGITAAIARTETGRAGLRRLFVPYHYLQGAGRHALTQALKTVSNIPRVEQEYAAKVVGDIFAQAKEEEKQRVQYWLDIGAQVKGPTGKVEYETFDEFVARVNRTMDDAYAARTATATTYGLRSTPPPTHMKPSDLAGRLGEQKRTLQSMLETVGAVDPVTGRLVHTKPEFAGAPEIPVRQLDLLREPLGGGTTTSYPAAELIQQMIDNTDRMLTSKTLPKRYETQALVKELERARALRSAGTAVPPTTLEMLEPNPQVRDILSNLYRQELDAFGMPGVQGPMHAILRHALDFGQGGVLFNYLRHIKAVDAPGIAKRLRETPPQMRQGKPGNVNKQRVTSMFAEPEQLEALGYLTDPEPLIAKTVAQYRTTAREGQFVGWVLENFGRKFGKGDTLKEGEEVFRPNDWFTKGLPKYDELDQQLRFLKESDAISDEEANVLLNFAAQGIRASGPAKASHESWALPRDVIQALRENRKVVSNAGGVLGLYDGLLALQRTLVTTIWPAYHARNILGNYINSHMGGVPFTDHNALADAAAVVKGDPVVASKLTALLTKANPNATMTGPLGSFDVGGDVLGWFRRYLEERGVLRSGQLAVDLNVRREGATVTEQAAAALNEASVKMGGKLELNPFRAGRTAAEAADNVMRVRHVLGRLQRGDSLEEAVLSTKNFLFDFNDLTDIERNVFRRTVFFYTWTRRNLPLQLEMLVTEPRSAQYWNHAFRAMNDDEAKRRADAALMPAWVREQMGVVLAEDHKGTLQVVTGAGLPLEDLNLFSARAPDELIRNFLGQTSPLIQWVLGQAGTPTGFTNRAVADDTFQNYYRQLQPIWGRIAKIAPGVADWIGLEERQIVDVDGNPKTLYTANPHAIFFLYNMLGMGRAMRTAGNVANTLEDPSVSRVTATALRLGTGINVNRVDLSRPIEALAASERGQLLDEETSAALELAANEFARTGDAAAWRERRRSLMAERSNRREQLLSEQMRQEGLPSKPERDAIQRVRGTAVPEGQRLIDLMYNLDPDGENPLTGEVFANNREFAQTRQDLQDLIREQYPDAARRLGEVNRQRLDKLGPQARELEEEYQLAVKLLDAYELVPKYRGLTEGEAERVDRLSRRQRDLSRQYGPAMARRLIREEDPQGYLLLQQANKRRNTRERQKAWRELNNQFGNVLNKYFGSLPDLEAADAVGLELPTPNPTP